MCAAASALRLAKHERVIRRDPIRHSANELEPHGGEFVNHNLLVDAHAGAVGRYAWRIATARLRVALDDEEHTTRFNARKKLFAIGSVEGGRG